MFGKSKSSHGHAPSNPESQDSGAIISGFVCPMCLLSFSSSSDLEVHFQLTHDKPQIQDDELVLMRQQISASEQTRELMQKEIVRHMETISKLEASVANLTSTKNDAEVSLQKALIDLLEAQDDLELQKTGKAELAQEKLLLQQQLEEYKSKISSLPDSKRVTELEAKCLAAEELLSSTKLDAETAESNRLAEVANLHSQLNGLKNSYDGFMKSLYHLLESIKESEANGLLVSDTRHLDSEFSDILSKISHEFSVQIQDKEKLRSAIRDHEAMRLSFLQEQQKLADQISNLETIHTQTKNNLASVSEQICSGSELIINQLDELGMLEEIQKSFDQLNTRNNKLQAEIERSVSDEDLLKRLKQEYEDEKSLLTHEIASLKSELAGSKEAFRNIESANHESQSHMAKLKVQLEECSLERSALEADVKSQIDRIRCIFEKLGVGECVFTRSSSDTDFNKLMEKVLGERDKLQSEFEILNQSFKEKCALLSSHEESKKMADEQLASSSMTQKQLETAVLAKDEELAQSNIKLLSLEHEIMLLKENNAKMIEKCSQYLAANEEMESFKRIMEDETTCLRSKLEVSESQLEKCRELLSQKESNIKALEDNIRTIDCRWVEAMSEVTNLAAHKESIEKQLADASAKCHAIEDDNQKLKSDNASIRQDLSASEIEIRGYRDRLEHFDRALQETKELKSSIEEQFSQERSKWEADKNLATKELEAVKGDLAGLQLCIDKEKLATAELAAELRMARQASKNLEAVNCQLRAENLNISEELSLFKTKLADLEQTCSKMKDIYLAEIAQVKGEVEKQWEAKELMLKTQFSNLEVKLRGESASLLARLEQSQTENQELEDEITSCHNRLKDLQVALQELGREQQNLQIQNTKIKEHRWQDDEAATNCSKCDKAFSLSIRRHHCRNCGQVFCHTCSSQVALIGAFSKKPVRVCDACYKDIHGSM